MNSKRFKTLSRKQRKNTLTKRINFFIAKPNIEN